MDILEDTAVQCELCSGESHVLVVINGKFTCEECVRRGKTGMRMTPDHIAHLRNKLTIISGNAQLIESDERADVFDIHRAKLVIRAVSEISEVMGWTQKAAEIREAVAEQRSHDAHLGTVGGE